MVYDGNDIQYLLKKKNLSLTDVARELGVSTPAIFYVIRGFKKSKRIIQHIEKRLGMYPGSLEISREKREALIKVA